MSQITEYQLEKIANALDNIHSELLLIREQQNVLKIASRNTTYNNEFFDHVAAMGAAAFHSAFSSDCQSKRVENLKHMEADTNPNIY